MLLGVIPHGHGPRGLRVHIYPSACKRASRQPYRYIRYAEVLSTPATLLVSPLTALGPVTGQQGKRMCGVIKTKKNYKKMRKYLHIF